MTVLKKIKKSVKSISLNFIPKEQPAEFTWASKAFSEQMGSYFFVRTDRAGRVSQCEKLEVGSCLNGWWWDICALFL